MLTKWLVLDKMPLASDNSAGQLTGKEINASTNSCLVQTLQQLQWTPLHFTTTLAIL